MNECSSHYGEGEKTTQMLLQTKNSNYDIIIKWNELLCTELLHNVQYILFVRILQF